MGLFIPPEMHFIISKPEMLPYCGKIFLSQLDLEHFRKRSNTFVAPNSLFPARQLGVFPGISTCRLNDEQESDIIQAYDIVSRANIARQVSVRGLMLVRHLPLSMSLLSWRSKSHRRCLMI